MEEKIIYDSAGRRIFSVVPTKRHKNISDIIKYIEKENYYLGVDKGHRIVLSFYGKDLEQYQIYNSSSDIKNIDCCMVAFLTEKGETARMTVGEYIFKYLPQKYFNFSITEDLALPIGYDEDGFLNFKTYKSKIYSKKYKLSDDFITFKEHKKIKVKEGDEEKEVIEEKIIHYTIKQAIALLRYHYFNVFFSRDWFMLKRFILFIASIYQYPTTNKYRQTAWIFKDERGRTGKNMLIQNVLSKLFYKKFINSATSLEDMVGFNGSKIGGKILLFFQESDLYNFQKIDPLKTFLTEGEMMIEYKHLDAMQSKNYARCIFFSNHNNPIQLNQTAVQDRFNIVEILPDNFFTLQKNINMFGKIISHREYTEITMHHISEDVDNKIAYFLTNFISKIDLKNNDVIDNPNHINSYSKFQMIKVAYMNNYKLRLVSNEKTENLNFIDEFVSGLSCRDIIDKNIILYVDSTQNLFGIKKTDFRNLWNLSNKLRKFTFEDISKKLKEAQIQVLDIKTRQITASYVLFPLSVLNNWSLVSAIKTEKITFTGANNGNI